jgi:NADP-dependent 3-hydroxy acid dehydrogenase YdfG
MVSASSAMRGSRERGFCVVAMPSTYSSSGGFSWPLAGSGKNPPGMGYRPFSTLFIDGSLPAPTRRGTFGTTIKESTMSGIKGKVVVITGASSGIGEATARLLARSGAHVVLGARRTDKLERLVGAINSEGGSARYRPLDVTRREDVEAFVEFARGTFGRVDVIINNAGVMPLSNLEELKVDEWNRMIDVNIRGVLHGIAAGLPLMKKQGRGQFINLSSIGGHRVSPTAAVYCATKFAVNAISEGLRLEAGSDIRVTVISPGVTESELADSISDPAARERMKDYRRIAIPADAVARAILYAIEQPDDVDVSEVIVRPTANKN